MKALDLYKFVIQNEIEYYWNGKNEVRMLVPIQLLEELNDILPNTIFDDDGLLVTMKDGYIVFDMDHITSYSGIELKEIFKK